MSRGTNEGTSSGTTVKEFDGARSMSITALDDLVYLEIGASCYAFDRRILMHAAKKELGIEFIVESRSSLELLA